MNAHGGSSGKNSKIEYLSAEVLCGLLSLSHVVTDDVGASCGKGEIFGEIFGHPLFINQLNFFGDMVCMSYDILNPYGI